MLNNFIYAKKKSLFEEALNNGEVLDEAIVFIEDTKEIWNHGTYFDGKSVDVFNIEESIQNIINNKADKSEVPTKTSELTNDSGFITINDVPTLKTYTFLYDISNGVLNQYSITQEELEKIQNADIFYVSNGTNNIQLTVKKDSDYTFLGYHLDSYPDTIKIFNITVLPSLVVTIICDDVALSNYISDYIGETQSTYIVAACEEIVDGALIGIVENTGALGSLNLALLILTDSHNNTVLLIGPYGQQVESEHACKFIGEYNNQTIECVLNVNSFSEGTLHIKPKSEVDLSDYYNKSEIDSKVNNKQATITDLETIRQGAAKGATALQSYTEQYKGTVTGVKINGSTKNPSSGVVDLGTVITEHQTLKTINGESILGSGDIVISGGGDYLPSTGSSAYPLINYETDGFEAGLSILPNKFYVFRHTAYSNGAMPMLDITLEEETPGIANEYLFQFTSGEEPTTLGLPINIKFNEELTIEANKIYQISILNGLGTVMSWNI